VGRLKEPACIFVSRFLVAKYLLKKKGEDIISLSSNLSETEFKDSPGDMRKFMSSVFGVEQLLMINVKIIIATIGKISFVCLFLCLFLRFGVS
jgi:hypothetical protein